MTEDKDNTLRDAFDAIEKAGEEASCFNCGKKIKSKEALWRIIPGTALPNPFCDEICMERYVWSRIVYHSNVLQKLKRLRSGMLKCPNCGEEVIRYIRHDEVTRAHSMNHFYNKKIVGKAVHREIVGSDGNKIPEKFCYLDENDWRRISHGYEANLQDGEEDQHASKS